MKLTVEKEIKDMAINLKLVIFRFTLQSQMIQNIVDISPQLKTKNIDIQFYTP